MLAFVFVLMFTGATAGFKNQLSEEEDTLGKVLRTGSELQNLQNVVGELANAPVENIESDVAGRTAKKKYFTNTIGNCGGDKYISTIEDCNAAARALKLATTAIRGQWTPNPLGCYYKVNKLYFNPVGTKQSIDKERLSICIKKGCTIQARFCRYFKHLCKYDLFREMCCHACKGTIVNGGWSRWSSCSATCNAGTQVRTCSNPYPANGGQQCNQDGGSTKQCRLSYCPATIENCRYSNGACAGQCIYRSNIHLYCTKNKNTCSSSNGVWCPQKIECYIKLNCPAGMVHAGDGSYCEGNNKKCDLGYCTARPNANMRKCSLMAQYAVGNAQYAVGNAYYPQYDTAPQYAVGNAFYPQYDAEGQIP